MQQNMVPNNKTLSQIKLPYVARTHWLFRWGCLLALVLIYLAVTLNVDGGFFDNTSWIVQIAFLIIFFVLAPLSVIEMFISKAVFEKRVILHTNSILRTRKWSYDEVEKVETANTGHVRISFSDGRSIKIWSGEADLHKVLTLLLEKCGSRLAE